MGLRQIPGVGRAIEAHLNRLGFWEVEDLRGWQPEEIYQLDCQQKGFQEDRCELYVLRLAVWYAEHPSQPLPPGREHWWQWKETDYQPVYPKSPRRI